MEQLKQLNVDTIDFVVVNLYPFKQTILKEGVTRQEAVENIDIGGPTMLRSAAKNYQDVTVITDPKDYEKVLTVQLCLALRHDYGGITFHECWDIVVNSHYMIVVIVICSADPTTVPSILKTVWAASLRLAEMRVTSRRFSHRPMAVVAS